MKYLVNQKLATRISIITTLITFTGMFLLWVIVSSSVASMVQKNITNQMIDAMENSIKEASFLFFPIPAIGTEFTFIYPCGFQHIIQPVKPQGGKPLFLAHFLHHSLILF